MFIQNKKNEYFTDFHFACNGGNAEYAVVILVFPTEHIRVSRMIITMNDDYIPKQNQLVGFRNRDALCFVKYEWTSRAGRAQSV
jgi:hypothetical protein